MILITNIYNNTNVSTRRQKKLIYKDICNNYKIRWWESQNVID